MVRSAFLASIFLASYVSAMDYTPAPLSNASVSADITGTNISPANVTVTGGSLNFTVGSTITTNGATLTVTTAAVAGPTNPQNFLFDSTGKIRINGGGLNYVNVSTTVIAPTTTSGSTFEMVQSTPAGVGGTVRRDSYLISGQSGALEIGAFTPTTPVIPSFSMVVGSGTLENPSPMSSLAANTALSNINTKVSSGTTVNTIATIRIQSAPGGWVTDGTGANRLSYPTDMLFLNTSTIAVTATEKMRITSSGTLAIGLTSPVASRLQITSGDLTTIGNSTTVYISGNSANNNPFSHATLWVDANLATTASTQAVAVFEHSNTAGDNSAGADGYLLWLKGGNANILYQTVFDQYGMAGFGTLAPKAKVHISSAIASANVIYQGMVGSGVALLVDGNAVTPIRVQGTGVNTSSFTVTQIGTTTVVGIGMIPATSTSSLSIKGGLSVTGIIAQGLLSCATGVQSDATGAINACVASDQRLKKNILDLESANRIDQLRPRYYEWKDPKNRGYGRKAGFIAQEVEKVFPEAVVSAGGDYKGLDSNALIAALVLEVQELRKRVAVLEKK